MSKTADNDCSLPESACMAVVAVRDQDGNMVALNRQGPLMLLPAAAGVDCKRWSWLLQQTTVEDALARTTTGLLLVPLKNRRKNTTPSAFHV